jgi:hypothetical protein
MERRIGHRAATTEPEMDLDDERSDIRIIVMRQQTRTTISHPSLIASVFRSASVKGRFHFHMSIAIHRFSQRISNGISVFSRNDRPAVCRHRQHRITASSGNDPAGRIDR